MSKSLTGLSNSREPEGSLTISFDTAFSLSGVLTKTLALAILLIRIFPLSSILILQPCTRHTNEEFYSIFATSVTIQVLSPSPKKKSNLKSKGLDLDHPRPKCYKSLDIPDEDRMLRIKKLKILYRIVTKSSPTLVLSKSWSFKSFNIS